VLVFLAALVARAATVRAQVEPEPVPGSGAVVGRVFDAATGAALRGVTVTLNASTTGAGGPGARVATTDDDGSYAFGAVPPARYDVTFTKPDYRNSTVTNVVVEADAIRRADFPLPLAAAAGAASATDLEEFVVTAEKVEDLISIRLESDALLNVVGVEEFSKFAAGDVAEVLERVAGVNVVEGQFAIIRGLEDRYSSTLYNGAPIPSPDPDRQSVQLDLLPSDVVGNLNVSKTFSPELPSNSAGGAIDIITLEYPEEVELKLKGGTGWNENAKDRFLNVEGGSDVDLLVDGLDPVGTDPATGLPVYADVELLKAEGFRFVGGNPVGRDSEKTGNWMDDVLDDVIERDLVGSIGGRKEFGGREFRLKAVVANEVDYSSAFGFEETREPRPPQIVQPDPFFDLGCLCLVFPPPVTTRSGDLTLGELNLTEGRYEVTVSQREEQSTGYGAFGFDLDDEGNHRLDATFFYTKKEEEAVESKENGFTDGVDYATLAQQQLIGGIDPALLEGVAPGGFLQRSIREQAAQGLDRGGLVFGNFFESTSFERDRDLQVMQLNGDHVFDPLPGLHFSWAVNQAETTQDDVALGLEYFYEPCGFAAATPCPAGTSPIAVPTEYPTSVASLGPGAFAAKNRLTLSANRVEEESRFYRMDADYELDLADQSRFKVLGGVWFERADRTVDSAFLETPTVPTDTADPNCFPSTSSTFACTGDTALALGENIFGVLGISSGNLDGSRTTSNESSRAIDAWHLNGKFTFWEKLDLFGGARVEKIRIESLNDPFVIDPTTGEVVSFLGGPQLFPSRFLLFDRADNPFTGEVISAPAADATFNDQVLGLRLPPPGPCAGDDGSIPGIQCIDFTDAAALDPFINGRIDERKTLPSAGFAYRPLEGLVLRGAWSQTVARPSFREMGYYVSVEPGSDDLIVGNPQLQLSTVESYDGRAEYTWGSRGDLLAFSYFKKTVETPIESIIIRDPINLELSSNALYRTYFNNPNTAELWGAELEARKSLGFFGSSAPDWLGYFSIGGNYTYIDAEVARTEAELARSRPFFGTAEGDVPLFRELDSTRRLFNQPKWIFNADVTFDHPDWGIKATVAWFGISDVLDAAGTATIGPTGDVLAFTLDRYVDSYGELRATLSKTFQLPGDYGELTFRATAKNLTDSERRIVYDPYATSERITDREVHLGRDYDFSITYKRAF
jgi:outer membrane receptor protein involved in Fe transport